MNGLPGWIQHYYLAWKLGGYAGIGLIWAYFKARPHLPHHHDGYVSMNGSVWNCTLCGKPPRDLDRELADVRAYLREHRWAGPYMGPDRAGYTMHGEPKRDGIPL